MPDEPVPGRGQQSGDVERLCWRGIAKGLTSEDAATAVGASAAAGSRWFRERGGMPTFMLAPAELLAQRPKTAKLVANHRLRQYVEEGLSGQVRHPDGIVVAGPATAAWKGRNKPRRQYRRWATAWSPEQIADRLEIIFPR
jgi:hypothetical protein